MTVALRTSLIWHDEVMDDVVVERPAPVTLGASGDTTFVLPAIGLPEGFAIVRPGARGHVLTLSKQMRGTLSLGGVLQDVAALVGEEPEPFHAITLGVADWGVIELDDSGHYKLFFQFVPLEDHAWHIPRPVVAAAALGYVLASCAMTAVFLLWKGLDLDEAAFRGAGLVTLSLGAAAVIRLVMKQDGESRASLAFSVALHAILLFVTFQIYARTSSAAAWPGPREPSANYLIPRIEQAPMTMAPSVPSTPSPTVTSIITPPAPDPLPPPPSTVRHRDRPIETPQRATIAPPPPAGPGMLRYSDVLGEVAGRNVDGTTGRIGKVPGGKGPPGPPGPPNNGLGPTRPGKDGPPGPPRPDKPLDTGPMRPAAFCMGEGCGGGHRPEFELPPKPPENDGPRLTAIEIDQKVRGKRGIFRMCYQVELNHKPQLAGDVVVRFKIAADGHVTSSSVTGGTLTDSAVTGCILRNVNALTFPAKGGAGVTYPFVFSPGD